MADPILDGAGKALAQAAWQRSLFASRLRRRELLELQPSWPLAPFSVRVHRNQPFELVAQAWTPFLAYAELEAATEFGAYDDSFAFEASSQVDVEIVSLDFRRYGAVDWNWLAERVQALRASSTAPILITSDFTDRRSASNISNALCDVASVRVCDLSPIAYQLGDGFLDTRAVAVKGTDWSDAAVLAIARSFGLQWLPAVLQPPKKVVAVDLDNTLYSGVLGEDGVGGVSLEQGHEDLHRQLLSLRDRGVLLAAVTRNEQADVDKLFDAHPEWPLARSHFSAVVANWDDKADNVALTARSVHVGNESVIFVDDNAGELASVAAALPTVRCLHADSAESSVEALRYCPGLFRFDVSEADTLRAADLAAGTARLQLAADASDPDTYLRSLQVTLTYGRNVDVPRMHELAVKTNQFNIALARTSEADIARRLESGEVVGVTFALRDRLSDSGVVGFLLARPPVDGTMDVEEVCISCRALGRKLESVMLDQALLVASAGSKVTSVRFEYCAGPRNQPALQWLASVGGAVSGDTGTAEVAWSVAGASERVSAAPVTVTFEGDE